MSNTEDNELVELSAEITSAYVRKNALTTTDLTQFLQDVHATLKSLKRDEVEPESELPKPAVSIRQSVKPDYLVCLEDGKKFQSLKRHLRTSHDLSPDEYRRRWALQADYPLVAPNYSERRSQVARETGLGRKPGETRKRKG